jgi:Dolichyl-phosphate-mannose-protein mannosyltransferase
MATFTETKATGLAASATGGNRGLAVARAAAEWLTGLLTRRATPTTSRRWLTLSICAGIFLIAVGVRWLHWQDSHVWIVSGKSSLAGVYERYRKEAERMIEERRILFPRERPAEGDARMLAHPPGYPILLAILLKFSDHPQPLIWLVQIIADALAAVLIFLLAREWLRLSAAIIAGLLVSLSPHFAYYSLFLSPDTLTALPILVSGYLLGRAVKGPRLWLMLGAGAMIGVACWFAANVAGLAAVLAVLVLLLFERRRRWRYAAALLLAAAAVIAPITIRNLVVFHRFIPISIQAGLALAEGLGDYDHNGQLGMPRSDRESRDKDVEWSGRPEYASSLWLPDGIERDRMRWDRAAAVIRSRPGWFLGIALRRAAFMLRYNDSQVHEFPFNTASVPVVAAERGFAHTVSQTSERQPLWMNLPLVVSLNNAILSQSLAVSDQAQPVRSLSPSELMAQGTMLSAEAKAALADNGQAMEVSGDNSTYGEQFASAPMEVEPNTDYVLALPASLVRGDMAIKATSADRRITLASTSLLAAQTEAVSARPTDAPTATAPASTFALQLPFATGNRTQIRLVLSNNAAASAQPVIRLGPAALYKIGATPATWTRPARGVVRSIQRNLFTTARLLPLIITGLLLLLLAGQWRIVLLVVAVPLYYLSAQSLFHTEYRYILPIHYFLFILAGATLSAMLAVIAAGVRRVVAVRVHTGKSAEENH